MKRFCCAAAVAGSLLAACAASHGRAPGALPSLAPARHRIVAHFASHLPDPYDVSMYYGESRRYRVNQRFQSALEEYVRQKSDPSSDRVVELFVTLEKLTPTFDEIAGRPGAAPQQYAAARWVQPGRAPIELADGGSPPTITPYQITKSLALTVALEIRRQGQTVQQTTFSTAATEVVNQADYDEWAYSYLGVLQAVISNAIVEIDRRLDQARADFGHGPVDRGADDGPDATPARFVRRVTIVVGH